MTIKKGEFKKEDWDKYSDPNNEGKKGVVIEEEEINKEGN